MRRIVGSILTAAVLLCAVSIFAAYPAQALRFGIRVTPQQWDAFAQALAADPSSPDNPTVVTLSIDSSWASNPDWQALDKIASAAEKYHARLEVDTQLPAGPSDNASLTYLTLLSTHVEKTADSLGLSLDFSTFPQKALDDPAQLAFTLKRLISSLRGQSDAKVFLGDLTPGILDKLAPLYQGDFRAYVDGYMTNATNAMGEPDPAVEKFVEKNHLGAPLWVHLPNPGTPIGAQTLTVASVWKGAIFTDVPTSQPDKIWPALVYLRNAMTPGMGVGYTAQATEIDDASGHERDDIGIINLLDANQMIQGMYLVATKAGSQPGEIDIKMPTADITNPKRYPMPEGKPQDVGYEANQRKHTAVFKLPWKGTPELVLFERLKTGTVGEEKVNVTTGYRIPVEVILARHQAVAQAQDVLLRNYVADAQVDYHFKLPGGTGSLDVTFLNTFFFRQGEGPRWVQNHLLLNGVEWRGKKIPQLPIIEPEKVNTLPLALTLGQDYAYRYIKDTTVEGHNCFEIEFVPRAGAEGSLYTGKVWIDKKSYQKIKMSVRQTGLKPPQVSNDESDYYTQVQGPDGKTYQLLTRVEGQQIFSMAGRNIIAEREIYFKDVRINTDRFKPLLMQAEKSNKPMLQETGKGMRYLEKQPNGTRKVQMQEKTSRLLALGGIYWDKSLKFPIPLVGVEYFNYNWRKTNAQINLFAAGAINTFTISKVNLFPKVDGDLNAAVFLIPFEDRYYPPSTGVEETPQRIKTLHESVSGSLGWRVTQFSKLSLGFDATYYRYSTTSDTSPFFTLPKDHGDLAYTVGYSYSRRGWQFKGDYEGHSRTSWERWGLPGANLDFSNFKDYKLWDATIGKTFYLPMFQKIGASLTYLDGSDLDRFSQYKFSYLGSQSLSGFSGSGVRFDKGYIAHLLYQFNIANVIRFGVNVDRARVMPDRNLGLWQNHTGVGLSGSVTGPWETYWTLDLGYAVQSDIPAVKHDHTIALIVLKLW